MTSQLLWQRWDEADRLLAAALDLPSARRAAYVRAELSGDPVFCDLVLRLVERLETDSDRASFPPEALVAAAFDAGSGDDDPDDLPPTTEIGRYTILKRHRRGGMATVYEAERRDGVYEQRVALKVLRRGLDTEDLVARFRAERQILSSLTHPNIARLLDGGSTADGRPYLVMEFVDGDTITAWADSRRLDLKARLELFLSVADAVHAAHKQLVVHRDIKPSNVLVDLEGRVRLLDFGIAKLLGDDSEHTLVGARALTPEYASPEQLSGDPVTTATDVFQLGLLLRELLTGIRPRADDAGAALAPVHLPRIVSRDVAGAPGAEHRARNRGTTPAKLSRLLSGDLDIIVGKSLRPEPEERYPSANELAADIRRHQRGQPILAHPESAAYRAQKFIRRHKTAVVATTAAVLLLIAYAVTVTVQRQQIALTSQRAEREARTAEQVTEFLTGLFRSSDPRVALADTVTVLGVLDEGAKRIRTELQGQPAVRAALLLAMGRAYSGLGRYERADTLLLESLHLYESESGEGSARVADVLRALGNSARAERDFVKADSLYTREYGLRSVSGADDTVMARTLQNLSYTQREIGTPDSALLLVERAVHLWRASGDTNSASFVDALGSLAFVLRGLDSLDAAETVYREVLARQTALLGSDNQVVAVTRNNLGYLLRLKGDFTEAERQYREAVRIASARFGDGHPNTMMFKSNLAGTLLLQGRIDEVAAIGRERIAAAEAQWPDGHWRVGNAYSALGSVFVRFGRPAEGIAPLRKAIESYTSTIGPDHTWTSLAQTWLGTALLLTGRASEGNVMLRRKLSQLSEPDRSLAQQDVRDSLDRVAQVLDDNRHPELAAAFRKLLEESAAPSSGS